MSKVDLTIIIVNWNTKLFLQKCLQSLKNNKTLHSSEIIVVDNASTDGSQDMVTKYYSDILFIRNKENIGFAKANNAGMQQSSGRYIALLNSDIEVIDGCLDLMIDYMDMYLSIGILGPKILWPDKTLQITCREFPNLLNNLFPAVGLSKIFRYSKAFSGEHMFYFSHDRVRRVNALVGCFLMVRKKAIDQVGLLDEQFFIYSEEIDWCSRFWSAGWEVVFYPVAEAIHHGRGGSSNEPTRFAIEQRKSELKYWKKHYSPLKYRCFKFIAYFHYLIRIAASIIILIFKPAYREKSYLRIQEGLSYMHSLFKYKI
jgi:hypothetical protein